MCLSCAGDLRHQLFAEIYIWVLPTMHCDKCLVEYRRSIRIQTLFKNGELLICDLSVISNIALKTEHLV